MTDEEDAEIVTVLDKLLEGKTIQKGLVIIGYIVHRMIQSTKLENRNVVKRKIIETVEIVVDSTDEIENGEWME